MVPPPAASGFRDDEARRAEVTAPGLSAWQRLGFHDLARDALLVSLENYLDSPDTRTALRELEAGETYPAPVLDGLRELGLMQIFAPHPEGSATAEARMTAFHMCSLNALAARRDTSVAVTLSVNTLALLPAYVAATPEQLVHIQGLVAAGGFSSLLLSELSHGSNLLANQARAERGVLDEAGAFAPVAADAPCTHYRINGEKDLINGTNEHTLLFPFLRTRNFEAAGGRIEPLQARADFTMFFLERGPGMQPLPRWRTLPAQGADISGIRFEDVVVPAGNVLGREHGGMSLAQKTLVLSRGGVSSLAAGCLSKARDLATHYAAHRAIYGQPIHHLGAIADHLVRLEALDRTVSAVALRTTALLNAVGVGAGHYTAAAKSVAPAFAEEGVREGQQVLGARALLHEMPYAGVMRDVVLFGVFDGTQHVMLQELGHRLLLEARRAANGDAREPSTLARMRAVYETPPRPIRRVLRDRQPRFLLALEQHLRELAQLPGEDPARATGHDLRGPVRPRPGLREHWHLAGGPRPAALRRPLVHLARGPRRAHRAVRPRPPGGPGPAAIPRR